MAVRPPQKLPLDLIFCIYLARETVFLSRKRQGNLISDALFWQTCLWFIPFNSSLLIFVKDRLLVSCLLDMWQKKKWQKKYVVLLQVYIGELQPNIKKIPLTWKVVWNRKDWIQILIKVFKIADDDYVEIIGLNHTIRTLSSMLSGHN